MEYKFKAGQRVRILDVESLGSRKEWAGREVTLNQHDSDGWDEPGWSVEEPRCPYRFRESEMTPPGPVRTETVPVRRLEPGVYGRLEVSECIARDPSVPVVGLELVDRTGNPGPKAALTAPELRELARVALEIAEYLDAQ